MKKGKYEAIAFGFIPCWWDAKFECFEGKNWLCDVLLDFCLWFVGTFMPWTLEHGVPLKVYGMDEE